jgi:hypothetical protein
MIYTHGIKKCNNNNISTLFISLFSLKIIVMEVQFVHLHKEREKGKWKRGKW